METLALPHTVKIYECDRKKQLRLHCLFNLFQDAADMHADALGVGYEYCLSHGIGWVGANYHLKINRLPLWQEKIVLMTWASGKTAVSGIRDFNILLNFVAKNAPLRRNVTIEEIGNAAAFLLSDLASGITGEITYVDGGFSHVMGLNTDGVIAQKDNA